MVELIKIAVIAACAATLALSASPSLLRLSGYAVTPPFKRDTVFRGSQQSWEPSKQRDRASFIMYEAAHIWLWRRGQLGETGVFEDIGDRRFIDVMIAALEMDGYRIWREPEITMDTESPSTHNAFRHFRPEEWLPDAPRDEEPDQSESADQVLWEPHAPAQEGDGE